VYSKDNSLIKTYNAASISSLESNGMFTYYYYARVYIYLLFLILCLLNKMEKKNHRTVGTIPKSNILNDLEQLIEHTQVSKHSIGFK
jgi:hypothetical protein